MITGEIKNRIDQIWDTFWTGGITNSMTILEQMTYLFFMKMLDDAQDKREANARALGIEPDDLVFKKGEIWHNPETDRDIAYSDLRWQNFRHEEPAKMFATVRNDVFVFIKHLGEGKQSAYSRFMQSAVFMIQNPRTLVRVVEGIQNLDMTDRDTMGDVYEYMLGKMAASGNNGQFRTPRHIIRMMVKMMQPKVDWEICDPAMGSAGFIVEAAKYVQEHHRADLMKKSNMEHYKTRMFHGFDTDTTMLRIGAMNLMLHGVDAPDVKWQDSLSPENEDTDCYDLILANPPFAGSIDGGNIAKSLLAVTNTKKTELLFLALFVRMLRIGGSCASIVPDGVLFGDGRAHRAIKEELVDHQHLRAVISMPSGVFLPYSGVSTAILIFSKTNAGGTDKVWFYDMKADGFSLDQRRIPIEQNDIPEIISRYANLKEEETRSRQDKSFLVPAEEIRANGYNLSLERYREASEIKVNYEPTDVLMSRIVNLQQDISAAIAEFQKTFLQ